MRLDRVLRDEELLADLAVAEPGRDQAEDLVLAGREAEVFQLLRLERDPPTLPHAHFLHHDHFLLSGVPLTIEAQAQPSADCRKDQRDQSAIDLGWIRTDEMLILDHLQKRDERTADRSVEEYPFQESGSVS